MVPVFPGCTGVLSHFGTVHPQLGFTFDKIKGLSPVFLKVKVRYPLELASIEPYYIVVFSNEIVCADINPPIPKRNNPPINFFIKFYFF